MDQYDMIMHVSNPASGLSFPADQNLPQQGRGGGEGVLISTSGNNADSNGVVIPSRVNLGTRGSMRTRYEQGGMPILMRGSSSRSGVYV
ncbi:hypothetical protein KY285_009919 [Solanum tuberosum]|nr:hypothetical protein KY285_009919 [Solanum tuberosum]